MAIMPFLVFISSSYSGESIIMTPRLYIFYTPTMSLSTHASLHASFVMIFSFWRLQVGVAHQKPY